MAVSKKVKVRLDIESGFLDYEGDPESTSSVFSEAAMAFNVKSQNLKIDPKIIGLNILVILAISTMVSAAMNRPNICPIQESGYEQSR